jgi:hypothetical protein
MWLGEPEPRSDPPGQDQADDADGDVHRHDPGVVMQSVVGQRTGRTPAEVAQDRLDEGTEDERGDVERDRLHPLQHAAVEQRRSDHSEDDEESEEDLEYVLLRGRLRVEELGEVGEEFATQPPLLERFAEGMRRAECLVVLPDPDRITDERDAEAAAERTDDLLDPGIEQVFTPYHARVDQAEAEDDDHRHDHRQGVEDVADEYVRRNLILKELHLGSPLSYLSHLPSLGNGGSYLLGG